MPYTIDEIIADGGQAAGLIQRIKSAVEAMPPPPAPVSAEAWGKLVGEVAPELGVLVDQVRKHIAS